MTATAILTDLAARGVRMIPTGDRLAVDAQTGTLTEADRDLLRAHKSDLLAILTEPGRCPRCADKLDLQDKARDCWWCAGCKLFSMARSGHTNGREENESRCLKRA